MDQWLMGIVMVEADYKSPELIDHVLWNYPLASEIWHKVFVSLDLSFPAINTVAASFEWVEDL
ncbi:hypothetical protein CTI12_AA383870 [Artemisia annua]|uniref:Uncharacterized protein n=1 Tax=Artemisia annua TaxID=35608 RepID=A0A2U1MG73_ARTAN|nr:hypothetical protein CTI12_AA383870 [Artemisia annua]